MKENFQKLYQKLCTPITFAEIQDINAALKKIGDFSPDLLSAMQEQLFQRHWGCLCKLIWAIPDPTPPLFGPILCDLLDNHREIEIMEAVADAMFSLRDERAVPSLVGALDHYLVGDADYHFNRKLLYALANINNGEAVAGLTLALESPEELIRRTA